MAHMDTGGSDRTQSMAGQQSRHADDADVIPVPRITSSDLLGAIREIEIDHGGRIYRLRLTQSNKLILTA